MNTKLVIIIVAVVLLAGGGAFYYYSNFNETTMARQALQGNGSVTCTFVDPDTGEDGTLYVRDGDMRVEVLAPSIDMSAEETPEEVVPANLLYLDDNVYAWSDGESQGFQFSVDDEDLLSEDGTTTPLRDYEDEEEFEREYEANEFSCERGVDADMFELPNGVEFIDFSEMFQPFADLETDAPSQAEMDEMEREMSEMAEEWGRENY